MSNRIDNAPRKGGFYNVGTQEEPRYVDANNVEVPAEEVADAKKETARVAKAVEAAAPPIHLAGAQGAVVLDKAAFDSLVANQKAVVDPKAAVKKDRD